MELSGAVCQQTEDLNVYLEGDHVWPNEREVGRCCQRGYKEMGRTPEEAGGVGAVPGSPGESNSELGRRGLSALLGLSAL